MAPNELFTPGDPDQTVGVAGIEFLEFSAFAARDADILQTLLETMGFRLAGRHRSKDVLLFRQGAINLIVNRAPGSFAHSFATMHGTSVYAMAFQVDVATAVHEAALRSGAQNYVGPVGPGELTIPAIRSPSGSLVYFIDRFGGRGSIYDIDFALQLPPQSLQGQLQTIDHVSQSVTSGTTRKWLRFYNRLLGLKVIEHINISGPKGRALSTVLADDDHRVQIIINEPIDRDTDCDRYLRQNFGEGVQHIAFATDDLFAYLDRASSMGVDILQIPEVYYANLLREGYDPKLVKKLQRYSAMIDTEGGGRFLHAYTKPIENGAFFEFVQRNDHHGFGRHDVTARLMALEGGERLAGSVSRPLQPPDPLDVAIDDSTMLLGTVSHPDTRLLMPEIMGHWLGANGVNGVWLPFKVRPERLRQFVDGLKILENLRGFSVAVPYKEAIVPLLDGITDRARTVGAVNLVRRDADGRLFGDMVDGVAFVRGLKKRRGSVEGAAVWLVGTGVEGRAIAFALAEAGVKSICLEPGGADDIDGLMACLGKAFPQLPLTKGPPAPMAAEVEVDIAINASELGRMLEDIEPLDPALLRPGAWVADIITRPAMTRLLSKAEALGHNICPGRFLLQNQVTNYAEFFGFL